MRFATLMYHAITREPGIYTITEQAFREQVAALVDAGFTLEGFRELDERRKQNVPLPDRYVLVTFDDGHASAFVAADILEENGAQATFFINKECCDTMPGFLSEAEIAALAQRFSIGSHGWTHVNHTSMPRQRLEIELRDSRRWLEDVTAAPVRYFSVPGGNTNSRVEELARRAGYHLIGTSEEMWTTKRSLSRGLVRRVAVRKGFDSATVQRIASNDARFLWRRRLRQSALTTVKRVLPESAFLALRAAYLRESPTGG